MWSKLRILCILKSHWERERIESMSKLLFRLTSLSLDHSIRGRLYIHAPNFRVFSTNTNGETKPDTTNLSGYDDGKYPTGDFVYRPRTAWEDFMVKTRLFFALPWRRFQSGSVLKLVLRGEVFMIYFCFLHLAVTDHWFSPCSVFYCFIGFMCYCTWDFEWLFWERDSLPHWKRLIPLEKFKF